jgi:hypothetical protein
MTTQQLLELHDKTCGICRQVMEKKNTDYCGGSNDPFANFRITEALGVHPATGILIRVMDKLQRIRSYIANGSLAVKDETFMDATEDVINYMILLKGLLMEESAQARDVPELFAFESEAKLVAEKVYDACVNKHHKLPRCGWRGMAGDDPGCILPLGHEGKHKFSDGSGG